jgi:hypothetical protein
MTAQQISDGHLRALHTLFGIYAARSLDLTSSDLRRQRLNWAARNIGREIASPKSRGSPPGSTSVTLAGSVNWHATR